MDLLKLLRKQNRYCILYRYCKCCISKSQRNKYTHSVISAKKTYFSEEFFVNIGYELSNKILPCHGNPLDFIPRNFPIIASFRPPDIHEISHIIDSLKSSSAGQICCQTGETVHNAATGSHSFTAFKNRHCP